MDDLRDAIFQRSAGIFLWVSLVVRQLNDIFDNDGRMDAIRERLEEIPRAAKEMPVSHGDLPLYGLFEDIIMKDTKNIPDLVRLTQLIFCAKKPLRPQEAFVALYQSYHKPFDAEEVGAHILSKHILAISKGLAEVTSAEESTVQFIHETVREFLRDGRLSIISKQSMQGDGNEMLKVSCLNQIKALDSVAGHFELLAEYRTWTRYRNEQDKDISASQRKGFQEQVSQMFPFLEYATQYVLSHANAAAAQKVPQRPFLDSFPRHLWVPLHNLFEKVKAKRFAGPDTPISYILAGHGLNDLIRILTDQRNYATRCKNEQCPTAIHNAIYCGHFDTAWVLVGLDPKDRSPRLDQPKLSLSGCRKTLLKAILDADEVGILRKVIQDLGVANLQQDVAWAQGEKGRDLILKECRSAAMIDCLVEHSMLPNIGPAEDDAQNDADCDGSVSPTSDVFFIRQAIDRHPQLLTGTVWDGQSMLDYASKKRFLPLFALHVDLIRSRGLALNDCLERAAMTGWLAAVEEAHCRGADLDYQNESGQTVLHKMFAGRYFLVSERRRDMCSVLQYLLFENSKLGASVDRGGYTALDLLRNDLWSDCHSIKLRDSGYEKALEVFVKAGAETQTGFIRNDHEYPWVVVPWISVQFSMQLAGEEQLTNIDARDSLGRTALSWCFARRPGPLHSRDLWLYDAAREKGISLLEFPHVDVNSRDNSGRTILEHLIRHASPHDTLGDLTAVFFKSSALDVNLETSDQRSPLDLIISLHGTWPLEFGDIDAPWTVWSIGSEGRVYHKTLKGIEKQLWLSEGLLKTARLLLATRKVDVSEQNDACRRPRMIYEV